MRRNTLLWIIQGVLAGLFLLAGVMKLVLPLEAMAMPVPLPGALVRFVGIAEVFGAVGLILPGLLRIQPGLTPVAASGLVIIMVGATVISAVFVSPASAAFPIAVGVLAASIAYGRSADLRLVALK